MGHESQNPTHDAATRLWSEIGVAHTDFAKNKAKLGRLFYELRNLYSERANSGGRRLTSGHGVFEQEIKARGFKPRRVREWVNDHEIAIGLRPPTQSTSAKRNARRQVTSHSAEYERGCRDTLRNFPSLAMDPLSRFASLLPYGALKTAYRTALHELHPDHGGSLERTRDLIAAWEAVEQLMQPSVCADVEECARVN